MRVTHKKNFFQYAKHVLDATVKGSPNIPEVNIRVENNSFVVDTQGVDFATLWVCGYQFQQDSMQ